MIIRLNDHEYEQCLAFAQTCALNQQRIEFGQSDTLPRATSEISRDNMIGKMAEVAFAKMLHKRYGIDIKLDFNYYPRGKWDDQDAVINGWLIDVKATRKGGKWMLIEWSKLKFRQKQNMLSHLYVMASVDWDRTQDLPHREVDLVGCASIIRLMPGAEKTEVLKKLLGESEDLNFRKYIYSDTLPDDAVVDLSPNKEEEYKNESWFFKILFFIFKFLFSVKYTRRILFFEDSHKAALDAEETLRGKVYAYLVSSLLV